MGNYHPIIRYRPKDPHDIRDYIIPGQEEVSLTGRDDSVSLMLEYPWRREKPTEACEDFDLEYFLVLDEDFCQPYGPFYDFIDGVIDDDDEGFPFLYNVVDTYYKYMDQCDWMEPYLYDGQPIDGDWGWYNK